MKKSLLFIGLMVLLVSPGSSAQPESPNVRESHFGVNGAIQRFSGEMREAGVEVSREVILWRQIEPARGQYDWSVTDDRIKKANDAGIEVLGDFGGMPLWAKQKGQSTISDFCAPRDINDFRTFAKMVAERYDGRHGNGSVKYYEILNEVTMPIFFDLKHTEYEPWLINGYEAVKEGNPDAKVLIGGFVNPLDAREFVDRMLREDSQYFDIVSFHFYSKTDAMLIKSTQYLKGRMQELGVNKPVWLTETATVANPNEAGFEKRVAEGVIKRYAIAFGEGVEEAFWWPLLGLPMPKEYPGAPQKPDKLGCLALAWGLKAIHDFHPRPAYEAYRVMTSKLSGFSAVTKISETEYAFTVHGKSVYVLWCDAGSCSIPGGISGTVTVTDILGHAQTQQASEIALTKSPVFIE